jgi:hypothetical protein
VSAQSRGLPTLTPMLRRVMPAVVSLTDPITGSSSATSLVSLLSVPTSSSK